MKIATVLKYITAVLLIFSLVSALFIFIQLKRMESDGRVVNYAGIVRGGTQRLVKLELAGKPSDELAAKLDKIITGLISGNDELGLPSASDAAFLARMQEVSGAWDGLKKKIAEARGGKGRQAALLQASEDYFDLTNKAVGAAEAYSTGKVTTMKVFQVVLLALNIAMLAFIWYLSDRKITRPLTEVTGLVSVIAEGNLSVDIPVSSNDEIGQLASAMRTMVGKQKAMFLQIQKAADEVNASSKTLSRFADGMLSGTAQTVDRSNTVAAASEEMSANMRSVATTMEQSTANVNTVASSTEELTSTVREISNDSERARGIMGDTVEQVNALSERVNELGRSAKDIGKITESITAISAQTNLLALNATIEAARAGAAGKGFAVVANEIKELAKQTASATDDIRTRIEAIQASTGQNVTEIGKINRVIREVYDIIANVAALIEMQSTAIKDIAKNIAQAAQGIHGVNDNVAQSSRAADTVARDIAEVNRSSGEIASVSRQVQANAADLELLSQKLETLIGQFKI